ncbi:serine hydrolase domain-containing protein [Paraglaciecola sp.]|uniref:serine hydrolase domain-containing protein n=1 Tax=Paraglaciecola sp. TaxID=1920173 RepID=UPI0030F443E3
MLIKHKVKVLVGLLVLAVGIVMWPAYEYFAYKGKIGFPAFYQFIEIPNDSPSTQLVHNKRYAQAGIKALELLTQHKTSINAPAISAAVAIDGEIVWAGASGWADIEAEIPVTTETQFRIGSTSKALTATALTRMVDGKLINIDKPISAYMHDLPNANWYNITPRQLVSHMAGLPHYKENTDYLGLYKTMSLSSRFEQVEDALEVFDGSELLFEPGTQFSYSTFGTVLLSAVMQSAAGLPYLDIMQQQVFDPLKMTATMAEFKIENKQNLAAFYWNNEGRTDQVRKWRKVDLSHRLAGGGFVSTSSDLVKMGSAYLQDDFISVKTRNIFWTPQTLPDGNKTPGNYALGWRVLRGNIDDDMPEITFANHGGVSRGAQSWLMVIPEYKMCVAVNINANTDEFWDFGKVSMLLAKLFVLSH